KYPTMTDGTDADFLQVLLCQVREDPLVDLVVAVLVLFEAQAPRPDHHVHDGAYNRGRRTASAGAKKLSRTDWIMCVSEVHKNAVLRRQTEVSSVIVKIPERPRNPDFPAPEGFCQYARLWIIPKNPAPWCGREETPFACLVPPSRCEPLLVRSLSVFGK